MITLQMYIDKLPSGINEMLPQKGKMFTFISYYSYVYAKESHIDYSFFHRIGADGIAIVKMINFFKEKQTIRVSFDMTSLAPIVFKYAIKNNMRIYFIGAKEDEISKFIKIVKKEFKNLNVAGWRNGYFNDENEKNIAIKTIIKNSPDIVVIGMGCPIQDSFSIALHEKGFQGTSYTCGGFFHQSKENIYYYPKIIDKLNLRLIYRFLKEPHVFKRTFKNLIIFIGILLKEWRENKCNLI